MSTYQATKFEELVTDTTWSEEFSSGDDSSFSSSCSPWSSLSYFSGISSNEEEDELEMLLKELTCDGGDFSGPRNADVLVDNFANNRFGRPDHVHHDISSNGSLVISAEPFLDSPSCGIVPEDTPVYIVSVERALPVVLSSEPPQHFEESRTWLSYQQYTPHFDLPATLNFRDLVDEEGAGINIPWTFLTNQTIKPLNKSQQDTVQPSKTPPNEIDVLCSTLGGLGEPIHNHESGHASQEEALVREQEGSFGRTADLQKNSGNKTSSMTGGNMVTTMMLKNIPCKRTQEEILCHIDQLGYGGKYDFFYLPKNRQQSANLGYGFINFKAAEDAARFEAEMTGFRFSHTSSKRCVVVPAHVQGLSNNIMESKQNQRLQCSSISQ